MLLDEIDQLRREQTRRTATLLVVTALLFVYVTQHVDRLHRRLDYRGNAAAELRYY